MNKNRLFLIVSLFFISALAFLPLIWRIGYTNDDWYLMYAAGAYGPKSFIDIFSVDRPARALVMIPAYTLFGGNPLYYNLSAYIFRLISALAFFWLLTMLWPRQNRTLFLASLLYLIYPGFLSQYNGIDYQSQMVSLAAAMLSIALSVKVAFTDRLWKKIILLISSTVLGWLYLGLVEYFIGFEALRVASLFLLSYRENTLWKDKILHGIKQWIPNIFIPLVFLFWRVFLFQSDRGATDINVQFEQVKLYPIQTLYHWAIRIMQDLVDVTLTAWVTPLSQLVPYIQRWGVVLVVVTAIPFAFILFLQRNGDAQAETKNGFPTEALIVGMIMAISGLVPVIMVNREVSFPFFSRYSLASSVGVALFFVALISKLNGRILQNGIVIILFVISMLTHHANEMKAVQQTAYTRAFWWQVSWRVPQFEMNTTLIANYPGVVLEEDYFVWGPANLIYYPEKRNEKYIQPSLYAAILNKETIEKVLSRERQEYDKRKNIITYKNYRNIVVMTQIGVNSCVHILDGTRPEYSQGELDLIREVGPYSEIEHVLADETPHTPPTIVFGPEPDHGWCYYYQKADLARQSGEWNQVLSIGEQAFGQGFEPRDLIEWMPFLQAYAQTGNVRRLQDIREQMKKADPFVFQQACEMLTSIPDLSESVTETVNSLYCMKN